MSAAAPPRLQNPYVGPRAFDAVERTLFFGRENERRHLEALIVAHRAVLLYAKSGAGKTSLLRAGLIPALQERRRLAALPLARVSGRVPRHVPNPFVYNTLVSLYGAKARPSELAGRSLSEGLAPLMQPAEGDHRPRPRLLILDQFEELFTSHARHADRAGFFAQLRDCLDTYPRLSLLLSMREDHIAHLDPFAGLLPDRLRTRFRLERLGPEQALLAITGPPAAIESPRRYDAGCAEALVKSLRRVQRRVVGASGSELTYVPGRHVEPVHLQIVCHQLWEKLPPDDMLIEMADIEQFGDVDQALTGLYERAIAAALPAAGMGERRLRHWIENQLITPAGTRGLLFRGDEETEGLPNAALGVLVDKYVVRAELRGGETWIELSHDRLVEPILASNRAWRETHANPLAAAVEAWEESGRASAELAVGEELAELEAYAEANPGDITAAEQAFLDESRREEDRRAREEAQRSLRRTRILGMLIILTLFACSLVMGAFGVGMAAYAGEVQALKQEIQAGQLAMFSRAEAEQDPELALILATAALGQARPTHVEASFFNAITSPYWGTLSGPKDTVNALAIGTGGKHILVGGEGGSVRLWTQASGQPAVSILVTHDAPVNAVAVSPDGGGAATASADGELLLHNLEVKALPVLAQPESAVLDLAYSPDGEQLLTGSRDGAVRLWNTHTGIADATLGRYEHPIPSLAFSPGGARIAFASGVQAHLWDAPRGSELARLPHEARIVQVQFSPDGSLIATLAVDGVARLWDAASGEAVATLAPPAGAINAVAFGPAGTVLTSGGIIATAGADDVIRLWDDEGTELGTLEGHPGAVTAVAFSPEPIPLTGDHVVASVDDEGMARLWDLEDGLLAEEPVHSGAGRLIAFTPDGEHVVTLGPKTARLWDPQGGALSFLSGHSGPVDVVAFSPDGRRVLTASEDGTARLWSAEGELRSVLEGHRERIRAASFSPAGASFRGSALILTGSDDGTARLWSSDGEELAVLEGHDDWIRSVAFAPAEAWGREGPLLATASDDGTARLWSADGRELAVLAGHEDFVHVVAFSPDGVATNGDPLLLTASEDGTARLWNLAGHLVAELAGHGDAVSTLAFSPDGELLLTGSNDHSVRLWDDEGREIAALVGHGDWVRDVAFSPDGEHIATASDDGTVRLWDLEGIELAVLAEHDDFVLDIAFSPDGERLATGSFDGTAALWPTYLSLESKVAAARRRLTRALTAEECRRYFREDPDSCPTTLEALFAPFVREE